MSQPILFPITDPDENPVMEFDFSAAFASVDSISFTVEPLAADLLDGTPTITGAVVLQRIKFGIGVDGTTYHIRCIGESGNERRVISAHLPIRRY